MSDVNEKRYALAGDGEKNVETLAMRLENYFSPKVIGEVNDVYIKLARIRGDKVPWHTHDHEDEMFYVLKGSMVMEVEGIEPFMLDPGEFFIVPQGKSHRVHSADDCWMMLVEGKTAKHTGDVKSEITKTIEEQL